MFFPSRLHAMIRLPRWSQLFGYEWRAHRSLWLALLSGLALLSLMLGIVEHFQHGLAWGAALWMYIRWALLVALSALAVALGLIFKTLNNHAEASSQDRLEAGLVFALSLLAIVLFVVRFFVQ